MIAAVLLLAAGAAPIAARRLSGDLFHPAAVVVTTWCGTLGLFFLGWIGYVPLTRDAMLLVAATIVVLFGSTIIGDAVLRRWWPRVAGTPLLPSPNRWILLYGLAGAAGVTWYVYSVVRRLGWVFNEGGQVRYYLWSGEIPSTYLFLQQFCVVTPLLAWALWLTGARLRWPALAAAVFATIGTLVTTDRTQFFVLVLTAGFMFLFHRGAQLRLGRVVGLAAILLTVLATNFLIIGIWVGKTTKDVSIRLRWPGAPEGSIRARLVESVQAGAVGYFYATGSYPALSEYLKQEHASTLGAHVAYPAARLLQRLGAIQRELPPAIPLFVPVARREDGQPLTFNAYTFLFYPLEDFGVPGAIAYAGFIGLACGAAYGWSRRISGSPARLLLAAQVSTALALTFFVNKFNNTAWWYVLALSLLPFVRLRRAGVPRTDSSASVAA